MDDDRRGQVTSSAAEVYDEFFVPGLFLPWAVRVAEVARLAPGQRVLDVACGTGALTIEAARNHCPSRTVRSMRWSASSA